MKNIRFLLILLLAAPLLFVTCQKEEDYYAKTYYPVVGYGYVYNKDSLKPCVGCEIEVRAISTKGSGGFLTPPPPIEYYKTDANGRYEIRFIKRTHREDRDKYFITVEAPPPPPMCGMRQMAFLKYRWIR